MSTIEEQLRTTLRDRSRTYVPLADEADVRRRVRHHRRQRQLVPALGAAAAIAAGVTVVSIRQNDTDRTSTAAQASQPGTSPDAASPGVTLPDGELPLLVLPNWSTARFQRIQVQRSLDHLHQAVVTGDDGRRATVFTVSEPFVSQPKAEPVDVNGAVGGLTAPGNGPVVVTWPTHEGTATVVTENLSAGDTLQIARGTSIDSGLRVVAVEAVPDGMTLEFPSLATAGSTDAEYEFVRGDRRLQLHLYGGGDETYDLRISGDERSDVRALGRDASLLAYGNGRFRVDVLIGTHTWEFDGQPFADVDEFLAAVDSVKVVDQATWDRSIVDADVSSFTVDDHGPSAATTAPGAR